MNQGLTTKTKDLVNFSDYKLQREEASLLQSFHCPRPIPRLATKGMFEDEMKPELAGTTDKKWLMKANPIYAEQLRKMKANDALQSMKKKLAARLADELMMQALRSKDKK